MSKIKEQKPGYICSYYSLSFGDCMRGDGCAVEGVKPGDKCPFVVMDQVNCYCYSSSESRKIREQELHMFCGNADYDDNCVPGCPDVDVATGGPCPFMVKDVNTCPCWKAVSESKQGVTARQFLKEFGPQ